MGRFINPFTDTGFKILFGQELSKPLLIDFLNNLLAGKDRVVDLKGDWDYNFYAVYFVAFMNFKVESLTEFRTDVQLLNIKTHKPVSEKAKLIYLQLPCFTKEENDCKTDFERWIYIFKNMEILERIPWAAKNSIFAKLGEIAEVANLSKLQRRKYDHDLKVYRDSVNILKYAKEEGFTMGEEKGRAEGAKAQAIETARLMKAENIPLDTIARFTNLSLSEIENL